MQRKQISWDITIKQPGQLPEFDEALGLPLPVIVQDIIKLATHNSNSRVGKILHNKILLIIMLALPITKLAVLTVCVDARLHRDPILGV